MTELTKTMNRSVNVGNRNEKNLTGVLAEVEYGIGILKVKEIISMKEIKTLPKAPRYIKGVINLRGKLIPVMDIRQNFGSEEVNNTNRTCIIVMEFKGNASDVLMGPVVDEVSEILNIKEADIEKIRYLLLI